MLKKYCCETDTDWDENIDFLLFAIRECPQESLGYSPFELLYGRQIRGPLKILKEQWFDDEANHSNRTVSQYIDHLKQKLSQVRKIALANLVKTQHKMKIIHDQTSQIRTFAPNDKVLLFLPIPGNPLKSKFSGPYVVTQKLTPQNYVICTPDRRKDTQMVHVNLLKSYVGRNLKEDSKDNIRNVNCISTSQPVDDIHRDPETEVTEIPSIRVNPQNTEILSNLNQYLPDLSQPYRDDIKSLLLEFPHVTSDLPGSCNLLLHDINLISEEVIPIRQPAYRVNPVKKEIMKKEVDFLLDNNLAEPSFSPWASPSLLVPKPDGSSRFCTDYRRVNKVTIPDSYPLPLIEDLLDTVGQSTFATKIDLQKGYYQIGLTERAKQISAFITPFGLFHYLVMPFGMVNAPATFQRVMNYTIQDLEGVYAYLDDLVIVSDNWCDHLSRLHSLLTRLNEVGFSINLAKSTFGRATITYLGHVVGRGQVRPKDANIDAILTFPTPTTRKSLMRFLGMAGFYRRYCSNFASIATSLTDLTSPKTSFVWTPTCEAAFRNLKLLLSSHPVLRTPDHSQPFTLQVDASGHGVGAVLLQQDQLDGILHPVAYHSAKLKRHQRGYSTIEREALSLVLALKKFECYLHQHPHPIVVYTDHNPLVFINRMQNHNQRILRWALLIQEYHLDVRHIKGIDNLIADTLSRDLPEFPEA